VCARVELDPVVEKRPHPILVGRKSRFAFVSRGDRQHVVRTLAFTLSEGCAGAS
jgi:hypothetical protein